ncbi:metallophosphoesterase family protein [Virgibacillus ainsalahensis]
MRLAFISDIHGNATALEAVLKDIEQQKVDKIFVLGDLCYRGLEPQRSLDLIKSLDTDVIKGNADEWAVRGVQQGEVPENARAMMNQEQEWIFSKLDKESIDYLKNLPTELNLEYNNTRIHAFHATPNSLFKVVQPSDPDEILREKLMQKEKDIFIYAHIHKPSIRYMDGKCLINTGSVGLPFDGLPHASYAFIEINEEAVETSIRRVQYDVDHVISQFETSDYPNKEKLINMLESASN